LNPNSFQNSFQKIRESYLKIQQQIESCCRQSHRDPSSVQLLAVSKTHSPEQIKFVLSLGQMDFGENYVQESVEKQKILSSFPITWHFIGKLQRNKVKDVVGRFEIIHSVDSIELATKISQKARELNIHQKILFEVNLAQEKSKSGFLKSELDQNFESLVSLPHLHFSGLMIMPPLVENAELVRPFFKEAKNFFDQLKNRGSSERQKDWKILSMGTTQDYWVAIEEGATLIRIGTAIFGERDRQ